MIKRGILISTLTTIVLSTSTLAATYGKNPFESLFGNDILNTIFSWQVTLPAIAANNGGRFPFFVILLFFLLFFSVVFALAGKIPIFQDDSVKGARIAFAASIPLILIFTTDMVAYFVNFISNFVWIAFILLWIVLIIAIFLVLHRGVGVSAKISGASSQLFQEGNKMHQLAEKENYNTGVERKLVNDERQAAKNIENVARDDAKSIGEVKQKLSEVLNEIANEQTARTDEARKKIENACKKMQGIFSNQLNSIIQKIEVEFPKYKQQIEQDEIYQARTSISTQSLHDELETIKQEFNSVIQPAGVVTAPKLAQFNRQIQELEQHNARILQARTEFNAAIRANSDFGPRKIDEKFQEAMGIIRGVDGLLRQAYQNLLNLLGAPGNPTEHDAAIQKIQEAISIADRFETDMRAVHELVESMKARFQMFRSVVIEQRRLLREINRLVNDIKHEAESAARAGSAQNTMGTHLP